MARRQQEMVLLLRNENWLFDEIGLMSLRIASINDLPIKESERRYHWPLGRRPDNRPSLSDFGF